MEIVHRLPPQVGYYEILKFVDPRFMDPIFLNMNYNFRSLHYCSHIDNTNFNGKYYTAFDRSRKRIETMISIDGDKYNLLLSRIDKNSGKNKRR